MDTISLLDNPLFLSIAFHPRIISRDESEIPRRFFFDGELLVDKIKIGFRLYTLFQESLEVPCVVYFHGNAELAVDSDSFYHINIFQQLHFNMMSVDYRGYGWSDGSPKFSTFLSDPEYVFQQILDILRLNNLGLSPIILWGRSIGSACAVHLAHKYPEKIKGIILESGLSNLIEIPMVQQISKFIPGGESLLTLIPDIFQQIKKLKSCLLPVLVLHGDIDEVIPVEQAYELYNASMASHKSIHIFPNCGHNDIRSKSKQEWLIQINNFLNIIIPQRNIIIQNSDSNNTNSNSIISKTTNNRYF
eukprot:gene5707-11517_t